MNRISKFFFLMAFLAFSNVIIGKSILIPMDDASQKNHLKAYGIAYWALAQELEIQWLLNFRGGSFLLPYHERIAKECLIRGVSFEEIADGEASLILKNISSPAVNMEAVKLQKAPKIAVYSPEGNQPWDDAVTLVLTYAEIPYDRIYDAEVLQNLLPRYDWLHLHHEDFTGQYGKFYAAFRNAPWYMQQKQEAEQAAKVMGFQKVAQQKLAVASKIRAYVAGGGFMFAMCSATDSYDIALAAEGLDICEPMFDGDGSTPNYNNKLNYAQTFAFKNFKLSTSPMEYEFSDIDMTNKRTVSQPQDLFTLFEFSAKWDWVPTMLNQNHTSVIKGFMGQTTAFDKRLIKSDVLILGEMKEQGEARYIHGTFGNGTWTFYGGHDPEDYQHRVGDPPTELELHPNSPGYRLILNNILFPAAKKEKQKT
jgi:hypothetical protein